MIRTRPFGPLWRPEPMAWNSFRVVQVVAMARNRVIGRAGTMPWSLPEDVKHFKAATMDKPMVMGRKTFESIGRPLPGRTSIVVTRAADWSAPGVLTATTVEAALDLAAHDAGARGTDTIAVIGGGEIYAASLPYTDEIDLTRVEAEIEGDTLFPELDLAVWREGTATAFADNPKASHRASRVVLTRIA